MSLKEETARGARIKSMVNKLGRVSLLLLFSLALAANVTAQECKLGSPTPEGLKLPRLLGEDAPQHEEPQILARTLTPEGRLNTVLELPAEADTYIASEWPDQSFGMYALHLGYNLADGDNFGAERMLLRFDVTGNIPQGAVVNDALLRLHLSYASPEDDTPMGTVLRRLGSTWSETTVTWDLEPDWKEIRTEAEVGSAITWYEWEITDLVEDWVARTYPNYGLEIIGDERVQQRERTFYSHETSDQFAPYLLVDYTDFSDTQAPTVTVDPLPEFVGRDFTVSWSGTDPGESGIASYDVQYRVNSGDWADWIEDATSTSAVFAAGEDGKFYEFRARGEDKAGNVERYGTAEASTTVDAGPPTTIMDPLPGITQTTSFTASWTGQDKGSGIKYYDVQYRLNQGDWILWQNQTLVTRTTFTALKDGLYDFEARAVDNLGMKEVFTNQAEATIIVDVELPFVDKPSWLPVIVSSGND